MAKLRAATSLGTAVCVRGGGGARAPRALTSEPRRRWRFWTSGGKREREGELTRGRETRACPQVPSRSRPWSATSAPYNDPPLRGAGGPPLEEGAGGGERERGLGRRGTRSRERRNAGPGDGGRRPRSEAAEGLVVSWAWFSRAENASLARGRGRPAGALVQSCEWVSQALLKQRGLVSPGGPSPATVSPSTPPPLSPRAPSARA